MHVQMQIYVLHEIIVIIEYIVNAMNMHMRDIHKIIPGFLRNLSPASGGQTSPGRGGQ